MLARQDDSAERATADLVRALTVAGVLLIIVGIPLAVGLSRSVTGPLRRLSDATGDVARGKVPEPLPTTGPIEVAEASELELCMAEPIIAHDLLHGMLILKNACITLASRCIVGIEANREVCRQYVENSIGLITALVPVIGYEKSAAIAKEALKTGGSVYALVQEKGLMSKEKLDDMLRPENMTDPREIPK